MKYLLADGNWLLHRFYHAVGKKSSAPEKRIPHMVLNGFCQAAVRMDCGGGAICFDGPKVFRHQVYDQYKQNRHKEIEGEFQEGGFSAEKTLSQSDIINGMIPTTMKLFSEHGIYSEQRIDLEADDMLASGARYFTSNSQTNEVVFQARDKDLFQCVNDRVTIYLPPMGKDQEKIWTVDAVFKARRMMPRQFLNYQILHGDSTDNIPSIPIVGSHKVAASIACHYDKLSDFFRTVKGRKVYDSYTSELHRNRQLVTMVKTAWTKEDIKFRLQGHNQYTPALASLKSALSKRTLFG